jgi:RHS repeat-associated protein
MNFFSGSGQPRNTNDFVAAGGGNTSKNSNYKDDDNNTSSSTRTTQQQSSASNNGFTIPSISLPKGGGAIRGIGEKFAANPVTGTGSLTVPIFTSPGRSGFGPSLSLSYDSGSGNGPFGFGWSLSLPSITRKTGKGIPKYQDANESDVFILSGAEDLVPVFKKNDEGDWEKDENEDYVIDDEPHAGYTVRKYRPRTEGFFARIERWTHNTSGDVHWRSISKDNILTVYGKSRKSKISDPSDESGRKVFSWLICESYDDKGNAIVYEYAEEDEKGIEKDLLNINERNRIRTANRYIKRIFYGNRRPLLLDSTRTSFRKSHLEISEEDLSLSSADWMFEVVFDYDEDHYKEIPFDDTIPEDEQHQFVEASASSEGGIWSGRPDTFSVYRSSFEIRTYRRCHRVLMFHRFPELGTEPYLIRSTEFDYSDFDYFIQSFTVSDELKHMGSTRFGSFIQKVIQSGYLKDETRPFHEINGVKYVTYIKKTIPPLEFEYSKCEIKQDIQDLDEASLENLPTGIDGSGYQFVDLDGEGVSGILTEQGDTWFYKPNLGDGKFGPIEVVSPKPSTSNLNSGRQQLMDLAGDGQLELVEISGPVPGFYERTQDRNWENFVPFQSLPNISWNDPNLRLVDLTGDGHADILITENEVFTWYQSLAEKGFEKATRVFQEHDEEKGPRLVLSEGSQSIYLADMSGDGLFDLVRIKNGEVCYWPSLGYGRFGSKVTMDNCPWFDALDQFDTKKIRLADIDGSGATDIIYIGASLDNGIQIYFNQSGNRWSDVYCLGLGLQINNHSSIQVADLLGNGTACLVWSSPLPGHSRKPMKYLDLMSGIKPHLLVKSANNLGAETRVKYVSSTKFYLEDKLAGNPWITKLPFPVHVIERVETYDYISRNVFVTKYAYHHGYFDGIEQEFRGFALIEQFDTEGFATISNSDYIPLAENVAADSHVPPVYTKTWFHTGIYHGRHPVSDFFGGLLDDTILPTELTVNEEFEASRALRGSMLRQEVYSSDGTDKAERPYTVTEQNFTIRVVQPRGKNKHAVFFTHEREVITYNYERNTADPRISHIMTLDVDDFGNVLKQAQIGYGRDPENLDPDLPLPADQLKQTTTNVIYTENLVTKDVDIMDAYRTPLPCESVTYELTGYSYKDEVGRFIDSDFVKPEDPTKPNRLILDFDRPDVKYEDIPTNGKQRRPIEHVRTFYRKNDLSAILSLEESLEEMESLALPGDTYKLAFTPGLIDAVYKRPDPDQPNVIENLLPIPAEVLGGHGPGNGGYVSSQDLKADGLFLDDDPDDHWWVPSGRIFFSPNNDDTTLDELNHAVEHFYLPHRYKDPFENTTILTFDSQNFLIIIKIEDSIGNAVTVGGIDYRLLQPFLIMDLNQNRSMVEFDVLGRVVGTAIMGKPEPATEEGDNLDYFDSNPTTKVILDHIANPLSNPHSILKKATTRLLYDLFSYYRTKNQPDPDPPVVYTLVRETHFADPDTENQQDTKIQHSFSYSDGFGREIQKKIQVERGPLDLEDPASSIADPRWVGTGWTIFNNKGKPIRQYEPFFSDTHDFEYKRLEGVSSIVFYDPVGRTVAILLPNNTYEKVVFDNWKQITYDMNDTVLLDPRTDSDISNIVSTYFESLPNPETWKTWYQERTTGINIPLEEVSAARKTKSHADTPSTTYFDSLGRSFITFVHNGLEQDGITAKLFPTRLELDIEGNTHKVRDEIKQNGVNMRRTVIIYDYNILGNVIHQASMDAGQRWMLSDILGNPIRGWDQPSMTRRHTFISEYDILRRPIRSYVIEAESANGNPVSSKLVERIVYGERHPQDVLLNLRGKIWLHLDQAGVLRNEFYDFKGNILSNKRQLTAQYQETLNWEDVDNVIPVDNNTTLDIELFEEALDSLPDDDNLEEAFRSSTKYDAMNRPVMIITPHSDEMLPSIIRPFYNEANMLEKLDVNLLSKQQNDQKIWTPFVVNIDYDAKGRRTLIEYGSGFIENSQHGVITRYEYDELTFRLKKMFTSRNLVIFPDDCLPLPDSPTRRECDIQNLRYTYDPVGNIIKISDEAQQSIFFHSHWVEPSSEYTYDPLYRLIEATGREHLGQPRGPPVPHSHNDIPRVGLASPNDGNLMGNYIERYLYDTVDNIKSMEHYSPDQLSKPKWRRVYNYNEQSLIEESNSVNNNQLSNTIIRRENIDNTITEDYVHDSHGNIIRMPHLRDHPNPKDANMHFNFNDQLQQIDTRGEGTTYYVYDAAGQRIRKVWEKSTGLVEERIYLGIIEVFRRRNGSGVLKIERETLHVMDDQQRISLVETRTQGDELEPNVPQELIRYQLGNHLDSATLELNEKAEIISYEEYTPYGSTSFQSGRIFAEVKLKQYRYNGKERDQESGLYYYGARYYASWIGRWTSADPLYNASAGGEDSNKDISLTLGLYVFNRNNPICFLDPDGKSPLSPAKARRIWRKLWGEAWGKIGNEAGERLAKNAANAREAADALTKRFFSEWGEAQAARLHKSATNIASSWLRKEGDVPKDIAEHIALHFKQMDKAKHTLFTKEFQDIEKVQKLIVETLTKSGRSPILSRDKHTPSGAFRWVFEKEIGKPIGRQGEEVATKLRVIVDAEGRLISSFPVTKFLETVSSRGIRVSADLAKVIIFAELLIASEVEAAEQKGWENARKANEESGSWIDWLDPLDSAPIGHDPFLTEWDIEYHSRLVIQHTEAEFLRPLSYQEQADIRKELIERFRSQQISVPPRYR